MLFRCSVACSAPCQVGGWPVDDEEARYCAEIGVITPLIRSPTAVRSRTAALLDGGGRPKSCSALADRIGSLLPPKSLSETACIVRFRHGRQDSWRIKP